MLHLCDAHRRFSAIGFHEVIRVVQRSPNSDDHLHSSILGQLNDLLVPLARIGIGILFKYQMGDLPRFEELR